MATVLLNIIDSGLTGEIFDQIDIPFDEPVVTLKDVISARVEVEVQRYNEKATEFYQGLVPPLEAEETLNGYKMKNIRKIDAEKQRYIALEAFCSNGYLVFIDDRQAERLEEEVQISPHTIVRFVKLTPLVGG